MEAAPSAAARTQEGAGPGPASTSAPGSSAATARVEVLGDMRGLAQRFGRLPDIYKRRKVGSPDIAQELGVYVVGWEELRKRRELDFMQVYSAGAVQPATFIPTQPALPQQVPASDPLGGSGGRAGGGAGSGLRAAKPGKTKGSGSGRTYTSKYRGVHQTFPTKRWEAQFRRSGKPTSLGCFDHEEEAARAYDKMMLWCELHNAGGVKGGITNFDPAEYEQDIPLLQQITQDELVQLLRSDGRRQAAQRMMRQKRDGQGQGQQQPGAAPQRRQGSPGASE